MVTRASFSSRESVRREWQRSGLTRIGTTLPMVYLSDVDMATMLMSMRGASIGEDGVQQGFPRQEGGPRLIRFESLRWRPKAIQVRAQFGVQEQCAIKRTPRSHMESVLDVLYMVGSTIS
jgi:hypothetical protein